MDYGIFGQLSVEEKQEVVVADDIMAEIGAEEAYTEVLAIEADINTDLSAVAQAQAGVVALEAQVAREEKMLTTPEVVTPSIVALSNESLASTAMLLGAPEAVIEGAMVSVEAAESNPVSGLQVSHEGVKDFLKKLIESIKAIFKKVMNAAKKLYAKLVVAMDGTAKQADKLIKHMKDNMGDATAKETKLSEKDGKKCIASTKVLLFLAKSMGKAGVDIDDVISGTNNVLKAMDDEFGKIDDKADEAVITKAKEAAKVAVDKAISDKGLIAIDSSKYDALGYTGEDGAVIAGTSFVGTKLRVIEVTPDTEKGVKVKAKTLTVDTSSDDESNQPLDSKDGIKSMLLSIKAVAKKVPKYKADIMKEIDAQDKALDKLAKSQAGDSKIGYIVNKLKAGQATAIRDLTTTCLLNLLLDIVKQNKLLLSASKIHLSYYKTPTSEM